MQIIMQKVKSYFWSIFVTN